MLDAARDRTLAVDPWREVEQHIERDSRDTARLQALTGLYPVGGTTWNILRLLLFFLIGFSGAGNGLSFGSLISLQCLQALLEAAEQCRCLIECLIDGSTILLQ